MAPASFGWGTLSLDLDAFRGLDKTSGLLLAPPALGGIDHVEIVSGASITNVLGGAGDFCKMGED